MNRFCYFIAMLATIQASTMSAQSLSAAKMYIDQEKYVNAAKQLQPLADGGNAEAQYWAAKLFFDGHLKTAKAEEQGVKYATMSADQGYEDAITLLVDHYNGASKPEAAYMVLKQCLDRYPALCRGNFGVKLAYCYMEGLGTKKNEALAWQILENNAHFPELMKKSQTANQYWMFLAQQAGKNSIEDYADYLFSCNDTSRFKEVCIYIASIHNKIELYYATQAEGGNAFACAMFADILYEKGEIEKARTYHQKSVQGGSAYGRSLQNKMDFTPITYSIQSFQNHLQVDVQLVSVEHRYDKTILHGILKGQQNESSIRFTRVFLSCDDDERRYEMIGPTKRITCTTNESEVPFELEFSPIPIKWNMLGLGFISRGSYFGNICRGEVINR